MHTREKERERGRERMNAHTTLVARINLSVREDFLMPAKLEIFLVC